MNKTDLISAVAERAAITKTAAASAVDALFDPVHGVIANELDAGRDVSVQGFGSFRSSVRTARTGHNPQTGKAVEIPAKRLVKFKAGSTLTSTLNG